MQRVHDVFWRFNNVYVASSGGKDSCVLLNLALECNRSRHRTVASTSPPSTIKPLLGDSVDYLRCGVPVRCPTCTPSRSRTKGTFDMTKKNSDFISPVYGVRAAPIGKIRANNYNAVAQPEMRPLEKSIRESGYTLPIICYHLADEDLYEIVDGFHRRTVMTRRDDIREREGSTIPVVVIEKDIRERGGVQDPI
jgi:hypothetical protein